jgi:hypothetical protein
MRILNITFIYIILNKITDELVSEKVVKDNHQNEKNIK